MDVLPSIDAPSSFRDADQDGTAQLRVPPRAPIVRCVVAERGYTLVSMHRSCMPSSSSAARPCPLPREKNDKSAAHPPGKYKHHRLRHRQSLAYQSDPLPWRWKSVASEPL